MSDRRMGKLFEPGFHWWRAFACQSHRRMSNQGGGFRRRALFVRDPDWTIPRRLGLVRLSRSGSATGRREDRLPLGWAAVSVQGLRHRPGPGRQAPRRSGTGCRSGTVSGGAPRAHPNSRVRWQPKWYRIPVFALRRPRPQPRQGHSWSRGRVEELRRCRWPKTGAVPESGRLRVTMWSLPGPARQFEQPEAEWIRRA
ncbi:MAG: hypothetical protein ACI80V_001278 [Rhodothermales bacterium]|jgi:hypothetical protein